MESKTKDKLERPQKMRMSIEEGDNGGFSITHSPGASLSFEHEPGEEQHHHFGPRDQRAVLTHIKKHLNLGGGARKPISGKSLTDGPSEREVESKGESVGLKKGKSGYKAREGSDGY